MPRNAATKLARTMVVLACVLVGVCGGYKGTTMAGNKRNSNSNSTNTALATVAQGTTPVAQAPHMHAQPVLPSTQPAANWRLTGQPSTAKSATNGVGPAPGPRTVGYAALACIAAAGAAGATLAQVQAAVTAVGLRGKHPAMPLLTWLAKHRGYTFVCTNGAITLG